MRRGMRALAVGVAAAVIGLLAAPVAAAPGPTGAPATAGIGGGAQASWVFATGTIAPGATEQYNWKVPAGLEAYQVGLSPQGALAGKPCQLEVTRLWYVQQTNQTRRVYWTVKNVGTLACGGSMLLTGNPRHQSFTQSALNPGQSWNTLWNIDNSGVWSAGLSPTGATSTKECAMELTRTYNRATTTGLELRMTIKNVGSIPCSTTVILTRTPADFTDLTDPIPSGLTHNFVLPNVSPTVAYWHAIPPVLMLPAAWRRPGTTGSSGSSRTARRSAGSSTRSRTSARRRTTASAPSPSTRSRADPVAGPRGAGARPRVASPG